MSVELDNLSGRTASSSALQHRGARRLRSAADFFLQLTLRTLLVGENIGSVAARFFPLLDAEG